MSERHEPCYAVLRFDAYTDQGGCDITVKEIVWTEVRAQEEVDRLNKLNQDKKCFYSWHLTRAEKRNQEP